MKWQSAAVVAVLLLMVGVLALQIWWGERQLEQQQRAQEQWRAQPVPVPLPGQPWVPIPLPPPPNPPVFLFPAVYPLLMMPLLLLAAAQVQREQKKRHAEEEDRTPYTEEDLMQDWEFKIIRSPLGLFDRPDFL